MPLGNTPLQIAVDETVVLIEGRGDTTVSIVELLIVERGTNIEVPHLEIPIIMVTGIHLQVLVPVGISHAFVSITRGQVVLAIGVGLAIQVGMSHLQVAIGFPLAVAVLYVIVDAGLFLSHLSAVLDALGIPTARFARFGVSIQVVGGGIDCQARVVREAQGKESGQPALLRSATYFCVGKCADAVFLLEFHIHHIAVVSSHLLSKKLTLLAPLIIDLDVLHRIGRQVVEHDGVVATEKVLAVEEQRIHILAVVIDASTLFQFDARQLLYQCIEHRALGQFKGIGIKHQRVAFIVELHFGRSDNHLLQHL